MSYDVAAYVWPAFSGNDPRSRTFWPEGIGEWETLRKARRKTLEHEEPRTPAWGYLNEADPYVMEMQIQAAADHGVNVFIYDWYWYDRRPFLENCLNDGYLKARNRNQVKFYLMWANEAANNTWDLRNSDDAGNIIWQADVDEQEFSRMTGRLIERYFKQDCYYTVDGKPVFQIYNLKNLIRGLGGLEQTRACLLRFREDVKAAGLPGLHLQLTLWSEKANNLSGVDSSGNTTGPELAEYLSFDSLTHYHFIHFTKINRDYMDILADVSQEWQRIGRAYRIPYFPHVSVGWDNNPRFTSYRPNIIHNNSPENVGKAFAMAKSHVDETKLPAPLITVNSWNEWTETSHLQPDNRYGYGYLQALQRVFKSDRKA